MSRKLSRLGLPSQLLHNLNKNNFYSCADVICKSPFELLKRTNISYAQILYILNEVHKSCSPNPMTLKEKKDLHCKNRTNFFKTSLHGLDTLLHGGIPTNSITEFAGPAGVGKTQLCLMLCILASFPHEDGGLNGNVLYFDTESAFSVNRIVEMATKRFPNKFFSNEHLENLTKQIVVHRISTCYELAQRLQTLEEELITRNIRLLIIDSIASLVRKEFSSQIPGNIHERTKLLSKHAAQLKQIAEDFIIPVVVTNQITTHPFNINKDSVTSHDSENVSHSFAAQGYVTAALGTTWSHNVNTRLIMQFLAESIKQIMIAKSPIAPFAKFNYKISDEGISLIEGEAFHYEGTNPSLQSISVRSTYSLSY